MRHWLDRLMYGRYKMDKLGYMLMIISMITAFISPLITGEMILFAYLLFAWEVYRFFSRNIYKRSRENQKYLSLVNGMKKRLTLQKNKIRDCRTHKYFGCPTCHNTLRVPKGRGEINVTCPVCKTVTLIKS